MDDEEWGKYKQMADDAKAQLKELENEIQKLRLNVSRGMGLVVGALAILGMFYGEIANWLKHILRATW